MKTLKNLFASYGKKLDVMFKRQTRVFANFVNSRIKDFNKEINGVKDLQTGVGFFFLLKAMLPEEEDLQPLQAMNFKNKNAIIRMNNCNILLKYLREDQGMKLHGITAQAVSQGDEKTILGLLWSLISKYQVQCSGDKPVGKSYMDMVRWVNSKVPEEHHVDTIDRWTTGQTIFHLTNAVLQKWDITETFDIPGVESMNPLEIVEKCIDFAYERMDIPKLIEAEDMCVEPDELTIMTYISYFRNIYRNGIGKKKRRAPVEEEEEELLPIDPPGDDKKKTLFTLSRKEFATFKGEMEKKREEARRQVLEDELQKGKKMKLKDEDDLKPFKCMYKGERLPLFVKPMEIQVGYKDDKKLVIPLETIQDVRQEKKPSKKKKNKNSVVFKITQGEECGGRSHRFKFREKVGEDFEIALMQNLKLGEEKENSDLFDAWYLAKHRKVEPTEDDGFMVYSGGVTRDAGILNIRYEDITKFENYVYKDKKIFSITKNWETKYDLTFYERTEEFTNILMKRINKVQ